MRKYKLEITEEQLELLSEMTDKFARLIVGQLHYSVYGAMRDAALRHVTDGKTNDIYIDLINQVKFELDLLHKLCWNQNPNQYYGAYYSEKSDTLFDMHEVFRHQLWKDREDKSHKYADKPFHWNKKIPLIKIEKL